MKHQTVMNEVIKSGKTATVSGNTYRVKLDNESTLMWMVFEGSDEASALGICGSYNHNVNTLKTLRQVLNR